MFDILHNVFHLRIDNFLFLMKTTYSALASWTKIFDLAQTSQLENPTGDILNQLT